MHLCPPCLYTPTHTCPMHRAVQREPLTRAEPVHTSTHTPIHVRPACTRRAFAHQHSRAPCTHATDPLALTEPLHTCTHSPHAHRHPLAHTDPAHCGTHVHTQSPAHQHTRARRACAHRHTRTHTELCTHPCIQCSEQQQVHACPVPCTPTDVHTEPRIQHAHTCTVPRTPAHTCAHRAVPTGTHAQGCAQCSPPSPWPPQPYSRLEGARPGHAAQRLATSCGWWYMNIPARVSPMPR